MNGEFAVKFTPCGCGVAQRPPNPVKLAANGCTITLPYPEPEHGHFDAQCKVCFRRVAVTAAGRPDDPRTIRVPCQAGVHN